jgi:hypothetical protein
MQTIDLAAELLMSFKIESQVFSIIITEDTELKTKALKYARVEKKQIS